MPLSAGRALRCDHARTQSDHEHDGPSSRPISWEPVPVAGLVRANQQGPTEQADPAHHARRPTSAFARLRSLVTQRDRGGRVSQGGKNLEQSSSSGKQEGPCGSFLRVRTFTPPDGKMGVIVQEVTRAFLVHRVKDEGLQVKMTADEITKYCTEPGSDPRVEDLHYWEAWDIPDAGKPIEDHWGLCSIIPNPTTLPRDERGEVDYRGTTAGEFRMTGAATFYEGKRAGDFGMKLGAVACANGLPSSTSDPIPPPLKKAPEVVYRVTVTWDSSVADRRKKPGMVSKVDETYL